MIRLSDYEYGLGDSDLRRTRYSRADYIHLQVIKTIGCLVASCILIITLVSLYYMDEIRLNILFSADFFTGTRLVMAVAVGLLVLVVFAGSIVLCFRLAGKDYDESEARVSEYGRTLTQLLQLYEQEQEEESV